MTTLILQFEQPEDAAWVHAQVTAAMTKEEQLGGANLGILRDSIKKAKRITCPEHSPEQLKKIRSGFAVGQPLPDLNPPGAIRTSVKRCARCGKDHENITFAKLQNPVRQCTHWALCPNVAEPILMRITEDPV